MGTFFTFFAWNASPLASLWNSWSNQYINHPSPPDESSRHCKFTYTHSNQLLRGTVRPSHFPLQNRLIKTGTPTKLQHTLFHYQCMTFDVLILLKMVFWAKISPIHHVQWPYSEATTSTQSRHGTNIKPVDSSSLLTTSADANHWT